MQREQTGITAEFWFYSQLQRLGYESYITLGNTKSIDIIVKLKDKAGTTLSFDVKSKLNFGGSFQYLNVPVKENHFVVFIDLKTQREESGRRTFLGEPTCYIVKAIELNNIAYAWESPNGIRGYGFNDKILWYLKHQDKKSITENNIKEFKTRHKLNKIDFKKYNKIIWTLEDFENHNYERK